MSERIEEYALLGDCQTAALVSTRGSIDWLCLPRFDSDACFAALLGTAENGRWLLTPQEEILHVERSYRGDSLVLDTVYQTRSGRVQVTDFMPLRSRVPDLVRIVRGLDGTVPMKMELVVRLDMGLVIPWLRRVEDGLVTIAGPDALHLQTDIETHGTDHRTVAEFEISAGEERYSVLTWYPSHETPPEPVDPVESLEATVKWWEDWSGRCTWKGKWRDAVMRSLVTLKALTYSPTGGITAAATTSLPEYLGGNRNWDYRLCWLRDAAFTLHTLVSNGFTEEACQWRDWLLRAVAGQPDTVQPVYGLAGERRLMELELPWLPGYENSQPVRTGNNAWQQKQNDVYGEIMDALHKARSMGLAADGNAWSLQKKLLADLEQFWDEPDEGVWEIRAEPQPFTYSRVMAWVAFDRAVRAVEDFGLDGPVEHWRDLRDLIHETVCSTSYSAEKNAFTQAANSDQLDASLLVLPLTGFLPATDPRVLGTVAAIERELMVDGFVLRYDTRSSVDGLPPGEGVFLMCTFWLVDNYALQGRIAEAEQLFERLLAVRNDVGLLAEEYDPEAGRLLGNFPQAFSHVSLVNSAMNLRQARESQRASQAAE